MRAGPGEPPFSLHSVELKVRLGLSNFRECFFQCVSNSKWAHAAHLAVATPVEDTQLATELRRLGASYGVTVVSFGLSLDFLEQLPTAVRILAMSEQEFDDKIAPHIKVTRIAQTAARSHLDWDHIRDLRDQNKDFRNLFEWIARSLSDKIPYHYDDYQKIASIQAPFK